MADELINGVMVKGFVSKKECTNYTPEGQVHLTTEVTMPSGAVISIYTYKEFVEKNKANGATISYNDRHNSILVNNAYSCNVTGANDKVNNITLFDCENSSVDVWKNNSQDNVWVRYSNGKSNQNNFIETDIGDKVNGKVQNSLDITL